MATTYSNEHTRMINRKVIDAWHVLDVMETLVHMLMRENTPGDPKEITSRASADFDGGEHQADTINQLHNMLRPSEADKLNWVRVFVSSSAAAEQMFTVNWSVRRNDEEGRIYATARSQNEVISLGARAIFAREMDGVIDRLEKQAKLDAEEAARAKQRTDLTTTGTVGGFGASASSPPKTKIINHPWIVGVGAAVVSGGILSSFDSVRDFFVGLF